MNEKCVCGARFRKIKTQLELYDGDVIINDVDALYCPKCNEEFMTSNQVADAKGKFKKAIPGFDSFNIRKKITKVGNCLTIPLAKELVDYMKLKKGGEVRITLKNKKRITKKKAINKNKQRRTKKINRMTVRMGILKMWITWPKEE